MNVGADMEVKLFELRSIVRNGLMNIHKTLIDARRSLDQMEEHVNLTANDFQALITQNERQIKSKTKTDDIK